MQGSNRGRFESVEDPSPTNLNRGRDTSGHRSTVVSPATLRSFHQNAKRMLDKIPSHEGPLGAIRPSKCVSIRSIRSSDICQQRRFPSPTPGLFWGTSISDGPTQLIVNSVDNTNQPRVGKRGRTSNECLLVYRGCPRQDVHGVTLLDHIITAFAGDKLQITGNKGQYSKTPTFSPEFNLLHPCGQAIDKTIGDVP